MKMYSDAKGFTMIDGTLTEVTLKKLIVTRQSVEDEEYEVTTIFKGPDGKEHSTQIPILMYKSVEDYEKEQKACYEVCSSPFYIRPDGFRGIDEAWIFVDGEPATIDLRPFQVVYDYEQRTWTCEGVPQTNIFRTKEECLSFNEYDVKHADGSVTKRVGINKLVMLDNDQIALFDTLKQTIQQLKDNNVLLMPDCDGDIRAFNLRNVKEWDCDYDAPEEGEGFEEVSREHDSFKGISIPAYSLDCYLCMKRK
ncbi:hypothetical protein [Prevotellamassilia timonensis]|uniref:hypothetical protein n=1 Tax=Prevotellamassilia timonensis TaxID=1852370 RepID=UPI0023F4E082|nr:hypothetical protein [Prevotellamassilia timonensis]MDD7440091.1 hypothetical protein [Prevotellamassilia timonensis]